jgi:RNA recognition motif-containing protein
MNDDLRPLFEAYGTVTSVDIICDKNTGASKGFGFVDMPDKKQVKTAIENLTGTILHGRRMVVNEARPDRD